MLAAADGEIAGVTDLFGSSSSAGAIYGDIDVDVECSVDKARGSCTSDGEWLRLDVGVLSSAAS